VRTAGLIGGANGRLRILNDGFEQIGALRERAERDDGLGVERAQAGQQAQLI
jgi:hypothetical protein